MITMSDVIFQSFESFKEDILGELELLEQYIEAGRTEPYFLTEALLKIRRLKKRIEMTEVVV